jgi:hypothetical protein
MLNWGVKHHLIGFNPILSLKPLPHDHPKEGRPLTPDEVDRLLRASPSRWAELWYTLSAVQIRSPTLQDHPKNDHWPVIKT